MPSGLIYLGILLIVTCVWFTWLKRPVYEAIFISFLVLVGVTNSWSGIWTFVNEGLSNNLLFSMTSFIAMSIILGKTKVIDSCIAIILALLGRFSGGAGYVSVIASAFMGALSGSGPGNVMATGAITIPAMVKSGFPRELAANIESNASCMGNMIPPSSNIVAALGAFTALYPNEQFTIGQFWVVLWGVSIWFILQRLIMVWTFCKYYHIAPIPKAELPDMKTVLREGWQGLLLPVVIILPFVLDYAFKDNFFTERLGAQGAKYFSSSLLLFIAGVATLYSCLIAKDKKQVTPHAIASLFAKSVKSIVPTVSVCIFSYMIGGLFEHLNVAAEIESFLLGFHFSKLGMVLFMCVLTCLLGMVITGSSQVAIFGPVFITALASAQVDPLLAAAMLPCICGVMSLITPPLGLCMYAAMPLAGADFSKTFVNNLWWVAAQFILQVVVLMGWLPILGL